MKYSYKEIKDSMPPNKANKDAIWVKLWVRPLSYPLSWLFLNLGITPNTVSVISIIDTLLACIFMSLPDSRYIFIGFILLNIFIVFDFMDGTMARTQKKASYMGEFYDAMGGYTMCAFTLLASGICAFNSGKTFWLTNGIALIIIGSLGSICDIFSRLIYQKYTANVMIANSKMNKPISRENDSFYEEKPSFSIKYLRLEFDRQLGIGGFFPPLIFISYLYNFMDIILILYSLYHILAYIAVTILFCRKATVFDLENQTN